ncbi:GSCFA family protein [Dinghuibacter silviterrae]|uniref:GSCFA family protein n=2 Tax=Dinghuibacter silviterrae TaxID=1539049 RepID=A0A4R8DK39_9BACT|nr:GSCFA family protein [Dinghuibacter silviterrae]
MKFRSELDVKPLSAPIRYPQSILLAGSCFTEHIGERLNTYRLPVLQNPHGIMFNPISLCDMLLACVEERRYTASDLFSYGGLWSSWAFHGRFSSPDPLLALQAMNEAQREASAFLRRADWLVLTLGSAWVYELRGGVAAAGPQGSSARGGAVTGAPALGGFAPGQAVANCHKAPADWFIHRLLSVEEVLSALDQILHRLFLVRPGLRVLFTISPVRHLREGMVENNRSKAVLIQAVHHLVGKFDRLDYFPAYELVIDDLRDYRFYAEDLVHPNYQATQYVWEKFAASCMDADARALMQALDPLLAARRHKPFNPTGEEHRRFLARMGAEAAALQAKYPFLDLSADIAYFTA